MIFHEIYGNYFQVVSKIIKRAIEGDLTEKEMYEIASIYGFEESGMEIIPSLKNQDWQLLDENLETPILQAPKRPITLLEKRWLKTILLDPRIALFDVPASVTHGNRMCEETEMDTKKAIGESNQSELMMDQEWKGIEPLFEPGDIVYFDRYSDGDPYRDRLYQTHFRMIRNAIKEGKWLEVHYINSKDFPRKTMILPQKIEYSDKEDKFRVIALGEQNQYTINIGRITELEVATKQVRVLKRIRNKSNDKIVFTLFDERKALERAMMQFAHYKKEVERIGENEYQVTLEYDPSDETDVLIQIMSFGTFIHVLEPESMKENIRKRLEKQLTMLQW